MSELASRFQSLFAGSSAAHGTYKPPESDPPPGTKLEIRTSARTIPGGADVALWLEHLEGRQPLGVIPIMEGDKCVWGCVDVDKYDLVHAELARKVGELGLPLHIGKSKSGGAHIFLFVSEPVPAVTMQRFLRDVAARLGLAKSEIFPKQTHVLREKGEAGNWLVMPYFGDSMPMLRRGGGEYTPEEFLREGERSRVTPEVLDLPAGQDLVPVADATGPDLSLKDGPPCLQFLLRSGFPPHTRNNGMLNIGIYCKKRWPQEWAARLEGFNRALPLDAVRSSEEMLGIINNLKKKDYYYQCKSQPLVDHCNARVCRRRPYGVGGGGEGEGEAPPFTLSAMSVLDTDPPLWFVTIDEDSVELTTEQLLDYRRVQRAIVERHHKVLPLIRSNDWIALVGAAMESVVRIEAPPEISVAGVFRDALEVYLTNRQRGRRKEDIILGRPWENVEEGRHYFQTTPLLEFLRKEPIFRDMTRGVLTQRIRDLGGGVVGMNINNSFKNCWWVPSDAFHPPPEVDSPPLEKEPM